MQGCPSASDGIYHYLCIVAFHILVPRKLYPACQDCSGLTHYRPSQRGAETTFPPAHQLTPRVKVFTALKRSPKSSEKQSPYRSPEKLGSHMAWKSHLKLENFKCN